jgi:SMODS-associating 4TM effector domain
MLPALLDATDLCQAHWRAAAERSELEAALDEQLDQAAHGHRPSTQDLRVLQNEINRQRPSSRRYQPGITSSVTGTQRRRAASAADRLWGDGQR